MFLFSSKENLSICLHLLNIKPPHPLPRQNQKHVYKFFLGKFTFPLYYMGPYFLLEKSNGINAHKNYLYIFHI